MCRPGMRCVPKAGKRLLNTPSATITGDPTPKTGPHRPRALGFPGYARKPQGSGNLLILIVALFSPRLTRIIPTHLADMATFSLATGLRAANVTGLEWSQIDEERKLAWVHPDQAKARKAIAVPLNAEALSLVLKQKGTHATHVFSYRGKPLTQVSTKAWYGALKRAGIEKFRWHDLRHTWASWHVQGGTPLFALQELGGWESAEMVRRYAHLAADHLSPYADRLSALCVTEIVPGSGIHGTFTAQPVNQVA
jgi:integrase